jgi:hypothetical protein
MALDWRGALAYPFRGPKRERPVLATWVLFLIGTVVPVMPHVPAVGLIVPLLAVLAAMGYLVRVLVASERGEPAPPLVPAPLALLRDGAGCLLVSVAYLAIPFVLLAVTVHGALFTDRVPDPGSPSTVAIYAGSTAVLVLSLLGAYLLPIGLATYGARGSLRAAFSRSSLWVVGTHAAYFAGWSVAFGTFGFVGAIAVALASAHAGGPVLATGLLAYVSLFTVHVLGRAIARAR